MSIDESDRGKICRALIFGKKRKREKYLIRIHSGRHNFIELIFIKGRENFRERKLDLYWILMAASKKYIVLMMMMYIFTVASYVSSSSSLCHPESNSFTHDLKFQCPLSISFSPPIRVLNLFPFLSIICFVMVFCPFVMLIIWIMDWFVCYTSFNFIRFLRLLLGFGCCT